MDNKDIRKETLERELGKRSFLHYLKYNFSWFENKAYQWTEENSIHNKIIEKLEAVERWDIKRLMIFCPPRLWKSMISSIFFPTRAIGKDPKRKVITSSYASNLASDFGRKAREIIKSQEYKNIFPEVKLSDSKREGWNWETKAWGWVYTAWVGWSITGKGADIFIIDDPVKDRQEADSPTIQERNVDWYDSVATTRLQTQDSAVIVIMTRWNTNDLAWYLLAEENNWWDKREKLVIKGINEEWEEIVRPWKRDDWYMTGVSKKMIKKNWEALYQQDPIASMDWIFAREYFDYFLLSDFEKADGILKKSDLKCGLFIDPAFSSSQQSDDAVIHLLGEHKISKEVYQLDTYADTSSPSRTMQWLLSMYNRARMGGYNIEFISVEEAKINKDQTQFIEDLRVFCLQNQIDIPVLTYKPRMKKEDRIKFFLEPIMSQRGIKFRRDFPDKSLLLRLEWQLINFPNDKNDDIIDCLAQWIAVFKDRTKTDRYEDWDWTTNRH